MTDTRNTAEHLIKNLEDFNIEYVFGYPGEQVLEIYEALRKSKIKHILTRHEQSAAHAADSYARITGKYGVCLATAGPGAMNLTMGVAAAYKDNVPLIVITGDVSSDIKQQDTFQDINLNEVFKPITIKSYRVNSPEKLQNCINEIKSYKNDGITGPFHINISKDIQQKPINNRHKVIESEKIKKPKQKDIQYIKNKIQQAKKPLIIVGSGIIYADGKKELEEFIQKIQIPITTTYPARGIISEKQEDKNLGLIGNRGTQKANYASKNADLILAFATRLTERTTKHIKTDNIIQINTKKQHKKTEDFFEYNIKQVLEQLNKQDIKKTNPQWINQIKQKKMKQTKENHRKTEKLHPEKVIKTILKKSDENTTIILDAGTTPTYLTIHSKLEKHSQMIFSGGFGPMGYSLPASIGASFARPDDIIFATTGDGSIQMTIQELAVISQYKLPVIIFIVNNSSLGIIKQWQEMAEKPTYQVNLDNPDFVKIAEAYNIKSDNITQIDQLEDKLTEAIEKREPHLFNIEVENIHIPLP